MARTRNVTRSEIYMILIVIYLMTCTTTAENHTLTHCDDTVLSDEYDHICLCTKDADNLYRVNCTGQMLLSNLSVPLFNVSEQNLPFMIRVSQLDLANNEISELPDTFFKEILHIDRLLLSNNSMFMFPAFNMTTISELDLSNNHLTRLKIIDIEDLESLKTLKLMNNNIVNLTSSGILSGISNSELEELDLSQNKITNIPLDFIARFKKLNRLDLRKNDISDVTKVIKDSNITYLNLSYNKVSVLPVETFKNLKRIEFLSIANNDLETVQGVWFPDTLTELDLSNCAIRELFECDFHNVHDLSAIHLHGNNLSCDCHMVWLKKRYENPDVVQSQKTHFGRDWMCLVNQTNLIPFKTLPIQDFVCSTREHEEQYCPPQINYEEFITEFDVSVENEKIVVTWMLSHYHRLLGIKVIAKSDDDTIESPVLHISNSEYHLVGIKSRVTYNVCIYAYTNMTTNIKMRCEEISNTDLSYLIGILAGTIFLIPCIITLTCIICADKKKQLNYLMIQSGDSVTDTEIHEYKKNIAVVKQESKPTKETGNATGITNISFISEDEAKSEQNNPKDNRKNSLTNMERSEAIFGELEC